MSTPSSLSPPAPGASPASNTLVEANELQLLHHRTPVLEGVSFSIQQGEFVYLIGKTGSGKTSLLRTFLADMRPAAGSLRVGEFRIERLREREVPLLRRRLGIVFQDFQLLPDRSVAQNLSFVLKATGWREAAKIKARVGEVLDQVQLTAKAASYPHQLSGGEQQRVAIARALINAPLLLLADEPTGHLDPETALSILDLLVSINRAGTAVVVATHAMSLIERAPARVLEVVNGRVYDRGRRGMASAVFA